MSGPCDCRHCTSSSPAAIAEPTEQVEIELPDVATPIRVHTAHQPPFDCTLHPDGTLTAVFNGEQRRNLVSFAGMREMNWKHAQVEFNPPPLPDEPEAAPAVEVVQDALL